MQKTLERISKETAKSRDSAEIDEGPLDEGEDSVEQELSPEEQDMDQEPIFKTVKTNTNKPEVGKKSESNDKRRGRRATDPVTYFRDADKKMKEWRHTLATDKKLSAKEKTRLRNKISALVSRKNRKLEHQKLQSKSSDQERNQLLLLSALDEVLSPADKEKVRQTLEKKKQEAFGVDEEGKEVECDGNGTVTESENSDDELKNGE